MRTLLAAITLALAANANAAFMIYDQTVGSNVTWRVGDPRPTIDGYNYGDSMVCQACDNELMYIQRHYAGIRMRSGPNSQGALLVTWIDDDCESLFNNL